MSILCRVLLALLFTTTLSVPSPPQRQPNARSMSPAQIPGLYQNIAIPPNSPACADFVRIRQAEPILTSVGVLYVIPHQFISIPFSGGGEQTCSASAVSSDFSTSSATILRRSQDFARLDVNNSLVSDFVLAQETFFLGTELGARRCGRLAIRSGSVSMWVAPSRLIQSAAGANFRINFKPGFKYIYYFSGSAPCLFRGDANEQAQFVDVPSPSASPSPSPQPPLDVTLLSPLPVPSPPPLPTAASAATAAAPVSGSGGGGGSGSVSSVGTFDGSFGSDMDVLDGVQIVNDDSAPACFAAHSEVWTASGVKRMHQLRVRERVLVDAAGSLSRVFAFTHAQRWRVHAFVRVETQHGRVLTLSAGHFVLVGAARSAKRAMDVAVGDQLTDVQHGASRVTRVSSQLGVGLYNAHTEDGRLVVNGLLVSTYTSATRRWQTAHALLAPLRALFRVRSLAL
eukprot:TRINITY_DN622_c0_g1_i1.p1 TRINITY_DN622_c0_g1~~TRINITY_DN622_c0_g1_i1.p1  ORF type:complete len:467 (+),score=112.66 TRINITY_DN622_c0_g1_i1:39-1403(+)